MLQQRLKILHAASKTQYSQIIKQIFKKKKKESTITDTKGLREKQWTKGQNMFTEVITTREPQLSNLFQLMKYIPVMSSGFQLGKE